MGIEDIFGGNRILPLLSPRTFRDIVVGKFVRTVSSPRTPNMARLIERAAERRLLGRRCARIVPLDSGSSVDHGTLHAAATPICALPRRVEDTSQESVATRPFSIEWHRIADACIDRHSSFIVCGSRAFMQSELRSLITDRGDFSTSRKWWHSGMTACVQSDPVAKLDRGIAVVGCGGFNWYHWMMEVLPKAMLAQRLPERFSDWPLIVPPEAARVPQFAESLQVCCGSRRLYVAPDGPLLVRDLIWIDSPSISPLNISSGWPEPRQTRHHPTVLGDLSRMLSQTGSSEAGARRRRVLLVRSNERRRFNQQEVFAVAVGEFGFEPVQPELLSLSEQIALFREAEFIIGPSGAAWTGLMFAHDGARGLIWLGEPYRGANAFANLAMQQRFDLRHFYHGLDARSTREGYSMPYSVCVDGLRDALAHLVA